MSSATTKTNNPDRDIKEGTKNVIEHSSTTPRPLKVAMMGAGLFATNSHLPTLLRYPSTFHIVAVWSRQQTSAETLVEKINKSNHHQSCVAYGNGDNGLDQMFENHPEIEAVIMALPLDVQPTYVRQCLTTYQKHVLSEKPIASTVQEGRALINEYNTMKLKNNHSLHWSVGENFRYEPGIKNMSKIVQDGTIGTPFLCNLSIRGPFKRDNPYLNTKWRNQPSWGNGGLFVDAFVHGASMVRSVLGCSCSSSKRTSHVHKDTHYDISTKIKSYYSDLDLTSIDATTSSHASFLPGNDTMTATFRWTNNIMTKNIDKEQQQTLEQSSNIGQGTLSVTYACVIPMYEMEVTGSHGMALLKRKINFDTGKPIGYELIVTTPSSDESKHNNSSGAFGAAATSCPVFQSHVQEYPFRGLDGEFLAFANTCQSSRQNSNSSRGTDINTPEEALADLEFVEACLESGERKKSKMCMTT